MHKNSIKKIQKNTILTNVFIIVCVFLCRSSTVFAQSSLSGGGYVLNGGLTVITGATSGGGYTLNPSGDPIDVSGIGGAYVLQPTTSYVTPTTPNQTTSSNPQPSSVSGSAVATSPSDFISEIPKSEITQNSLSEVSPQKSSLPGVQWIDSGNGVDLNLDGRSDIYREDSGTYKFGREKNVVQNPEIKDLPLDISSTEKNVLFLYIILALLLPVVRKKDGIYAVSKTIFFILIRDIALLHKDVKIGELVVRDFERNKKGKSDILYKRVMIFDRFLLPLCGVLLAFGIYSDMRVLSLIIVFSIIYRIYVGNRIHRDIA